ncbi:MAG: transporter substrate-binding domain-containing protein [Propionibacteriaceae bacterium]|jgi:polar amino acid transport system substrate-binding protein|nr:transporter substrate-binding domain-containing protein [Propionibacteriaceae bacterium]
MVRFGRVLAVAGISGLAVIMAACSSNDDQADNPLGTVTAGALTVCADAPYDPFEFEDPSTESGYSGFDIDLTGAIAKKLGLKLVVQDTDFAAVQSGAAMTANQCDLGASAITITPERQANLDFTDPYYNSLQSLLVKTDSGIQSLDDLADKRIGVQRTTTGETYANEHKPASAEVISFPSDGELWTASQAGQVDALLQDFPINKVHEDDDPAYTVVAKYETDESYGFAMVKGKNPELLAKINAALQELRDDGEYQTLYDHYFG